MSLRVLHVGLGPLGVKIVGDLQRRKLGDVVAAVDPVYAGKSLSAFVEGAPDVTIGAALENLPPVDIALVTTVSDLPGVAPTLKRLAELGISSVSTCEEMSWPWDRHPALAKELAATAQRRGVRMLGTGVNPGFVMDALAIAVTTACASVRKVVIHRIQDASTRRLPFQKKIGATLALPEFEKLAAAEQIRHVGLRESVGMVATMLGLTFDRVEETIAPIVAERAMTCGLGPIAAGAACGVHQEARAFAGKREVIVLVFRAAIGEPDARDQVIVEGEPPIDLTIRGGLHGDISTSAVVLNSVRSLLRAPPGLHTMSTIAMAGCTP
jgi:4-hydroxy-tetrahydrodipicolinate reductase